MGIAGVHGPGHFPVQKAVSGQAGWFRGELHSHTFHSDGSLSLGELIATLWEGRYLILGATLVALLLALLEMVRLHAVMLRQKDLFAPITVHKNKRFEEIVSVASVAELEASLEESFGSESPAKTAEPGQPASE